MHAPGESRRLDHAGPRLVAGVAVRGPQAAAVLLEVERRGIESRVQLQAEAVRPLPPSLADALALAGTERPAAGDRDHLAALAAELAELEVAVLQAVATPARLAETIAVGVDDPGLWEGEGEGTGPRSYLPLGDPARLAERTGLSVIDAFAARDVAAGGAGTPLDAVARWLLLHDLKKPRVLVDLDDALQSTYLPAACEATGAARLQPLAVGPGIGLLEQVADQLSAGAWPVDDRGALAAQGTRQETLLEVLRAGPAGDGSLPSWRRDAGECGWHVARTVEMAAEREWPACDALATITHYLAAEVARAVLERAPRTPPLAELVLAGRGQGNGLLRREMSLLLPDVELTDVAAVGFREELIPAAVAAVLGLFHIDRVPATSTLLTGATAPRVLGRLTPGSPQNWHRLIHQMADRQPDKVTLRAAM